MKPPARAATPAAGMGIGCCLGIAGRVDAGAGAEEETGEAEGAVATAAAEDGCVDTGETVLVCVVCGALTG